MRGKFIRCIVRGTQVLRLAGEAFACSKWFAVEPWGGDDWAFYLKQESGQTRFALSNPVEDWTEVTES